MILKGRVAVVTGAGSGIARAGAQKLASEGAIVVVADRRADTAAETVQLITAAGGRALPVTTDVTDDGQLARLVDTAIAKYGRIDILHSHAGAQIEGTLESVREGGMDDSWRLNVRAHYQLARLTVPHMRRQGGGSILITSSSSGLIYDAEMIAYATSKHAVVAMVKQIAKDYGKHKIRCNALCPGWVDTPFNDPFIKQMGGRPQLEAYIKTAVPLGRWASVEEVAETILFLASDRSAYITGVALAVDGGESIG
mgnify:CR=1 FL=1